MNYKRALFFGLAMWVLVNVVIYIVMLVPILRDRKLAQNIVWWVLEVPLFIFWAKAYFKTVYPKFTSGVLLWLVFFAIGLVLDVLITVPLFVKSYATFFGNWLLYVNYAIGLLTTSLAAFEFDATYAGSESKV